MTVYVTRSDPTRNLHRFDRMLIVPDLFGQWVLLREWGRIGSGGQVKADAFKNAGEAPCQEEEAAASAALPQVFHTVTLQRYSGCPIALFLFANTPAAH